MSGSQSIRVQGARVNNLRGITLEIGRDRLVALTGVSGSGKSSLAFGVLHTEGQRRLLDALAPRLRGSVPTLPRPDVDLITGLPPTIGVLSHTAPGGARSTVATRTELQDLLRALFAHEGVARCPTCGRDLPVHTADGVVQALLALPEGSQLTVTAPVARGKIGGLSSLFDEMQGLGFARVRVDGQLHRLDERPTLDARAAHDVEVVIDRIRVGPDRADRLLEAVQVGWGAGKGRLLGLVQREGSAAPEEHFFADHPACPEGHFALPPPGPSLFSFNTLEGACPRCEGTGRTPGEVELPCSLCAGSRLSEAARAFRVGGRGLQELLASPLSELLPWAESLGGGALTRAMREELCRRSRALVEIGLGHLELGRGADALSAGEARRLHLATQTGSALPGVLYVIDEPSAGLHREDAEAVRALLRRLVDAGSSMVVVTHDPVLVDAADEVVEIGPGAGAEGGRLLYQGPPEGLLGSETPTGRARQGRGGVISRGRRGRGALRVRGARGWNLGGPGGSLDLSLPLGVLVSVSGPSGSGKSALFEHTLGRALAMSLHGASSPPLPHDALEGAGPIRRLARMTQAPLGRVRGSCVATIAGIWGPIRRLLAETREARVRGFGPETFSFNRAGGRCDACEGTGVRAVRLHLLPDVEAPCERCEGRRFGSGALSVRYRGHDPAELLALTVGEARRLLVAQPALEPRLRLLERAGLGYLRLGQATSTLSGGEAERVRLARELGVPADLPGSLFLLDGPAFGLHPLDVDRLVELLQELVDQGASVIAIDNDDRLITAADTHIRMGPGAGPAGGQILDQA